MIGYIMLFVFAYFSTYCGSKTLSWYTNYANEKGKNPPDNKAVNTCKTKAVLYLVATIVAVYLFIKMWVVT